MSRQVHIGTLCVVMMTALMSGQEAEKKGSQPINGGITVTLSTSKNEFKSGEPINIAITSRNTGRESVAVVQRSEWLNHILTVTDQRGKNIPEIAYLAKAKESAQAGYRSVRQIKPGEEITDVLDLSKAFELKKAGIYRVSTQRHVSKAKTFEHAVIVKSNELTLTVTK